MTFLWGRGDSPLESLCSWEDIGGRTRGVRARFAMLDIVFLVTGIGFFGLLQLYAVGCAHLQELPQ